MKQSARILRDVCLFWSRNVEVREVKMVHILDIFFNGWYWSYIRCESLREILKSRMFPRNLPKQNEGSRYHLLSGSQLENPFEENGRENSKLLL